MRVRFDKPQIIGMHTCTHTHTHMHTTHFFSPMPIASFSQDKSQPMVWESIFRLKTFEAYGWVRTDGGGTYAYISQLTFPGTTVANFTRSINFKPQYLPVIQPHNHQILKSMQPSTKTPHQNTASNQVIYIYIFNIYYIQQNPLKDKPPWQYILFKTSDPTFCLAFFGLVFRCCCCTL